MASHLDLLNMSDDDFSLLLDRVESAFQEDCAAIFVGTATRTRLIDIFDPDGAGFSADEWDRLGAVSAYLDQFLAYAFEDAPASVVEEWANEHVEGSGELAVARVALAREKLQTVQREWEFRNLSAMPCLGDVDLDIIFDPSSLSFQALLQMDSFASGASPWRFPIDSSRRWQSVRLSKSDLARVIAKLKFAYDAIPDLSSDDDEPDGSDGTEGEEDARPE